jgi:hypothetical protein
LIIKFTEWVVLDSIVGVGLALFIMYEGFKLLKYSIDGLMDTRNPRVDKKIREIMREELPGSMSNVHNLRHRTTGNTTWIELHALFEKGVSLKKAHEDATVLERRLIDGVRGDVIVTIHLEPEGHHDEIHKTLREADQERPVIVCVPRLGSDRAWDTCDGCRIVWLHEDVVHDDDITAADQMPGAAALQRFPSLSGSDLPCLHCGCTELDACEHEDGSPCFWIQPGLCSVCAERCGVDIDTHRSYGAEADISHAIAGVARGELPR